MALILAAATAREMRAALSGCPDAEPIPRFEEGRPVRCRVAGRDILAVTTGLGPVCAALRLGRALAEGGNSAPGVVGLGVGGSFDIRRLPLETCVVATRESWPEFGLRTEAGIDPRGIGLAQGRLGAKTIFDAVTLDPAAAVDAMRLSLPVEVTPSPFLTVSAASGDAETAARRAASGAALENMEGFGWALACLEAGVPLLEMRSVSNRVGARPPRDWNLEGALASLARATGRLFTA